MADMTPEMLELVAQRFRLLADPMRLRILHELQQGELSVGELVARTEASQPNIFVAKKATWLTSVLPHPISLVCAILFATACEKSLKKRRFFCPKLITSI